MTAPVLSVSFTENVHGDCEEEQAGTDAGNDIEKLRRTALHVPRDNEVSDTDDMSAFI
jgi:hypothetical protein